MKYETMLERFLGYVNFKSRSDASSKTLPSTPEQKDFLRMLKGQLEELKLSDIVLNEQLHYQLIRTNLMTQSVLFLMLIQLILM